jgi:hypothetical protein
MLATAFRCSARAIRKRHYAALNRLIRQPAPRVLPDGDLVLLADGLWFVFRRRIWVLYNMAVKPVTADSAFFLDPFLMPGKESAKGWRLAFGTIPDHVHGHIKALVSDGFQGCKAIVREHQWLHQRCHFHIITQLYNRLGKRKKKLPGHRISERIYRAVKAILKTRNERRLAQKTALLCRLIADPCCRPGVAGITRQFLRDMKLYRTYLDHPELRMPATDSALESLHSRMREVASRVNNPTAVLRRIRAYVRVHPTFVCNGSNHQQN